MNRDGICGTMKNTKYAKGAGVKPAEDGNDAYHWRAAEDAGKKTKTRSASTAAARLALGISPSMVSAILLG
jgi:hypothetical protein